MELSKLILTVLVISYNTLSVKACFAIPILFEANERFSKDLFKILVREDGNLLYSPISTHATLSLMYEAAAGETARSLGKVLHTNTKFSPHYNSAVSFMRILKDVTLHIANKVFIQQEYKLDRNFKYIAKTNFFARVARVNFKQRYSAARLINEWIEKTTNGTITSLVSPYDLNPPPQMLLVNTIYFDSEWLNKFNEHHTKQQVFHMSNGHRVKCKMMHMSRTLSYHADHELKAQVLSLPYKNENFSLIIILPNKKGGIKHVERKMQTMNLADINDRLVKVNVHVSLPKFQMRRKNQLKDPLIELGMGIAFSTAADFSHMLKTKEPLRITKIVQKTLIDINESGTGGKASTVIPRTNEEIFDRMKFVTFRANHPFIFVVALNMGEMLPVFIGKLDKP